ncbi:hypothetical protein DQ237_16055 [Blastococcus sp. TF02-8]|uniref:hypothetical protein n=1 Tax=Blastococcus sp. TF02-8 TaxID=2250574 RepID=UPI000DFAE4E3|nr:hypothetical protein [Blastococcus sp. TF02-8]RBY95190.1 hypothetical protein DQ237_16055 [Blastococcus sp. TF02-8]
MSQPPQSPDPAPDGPTTSDVPTAPDGQSAPGWPAPGAPWPAPAAQPEWPAPAPQPDWAATTPTWPQPAPGVVPVSPVAGGAPAAASPGRSAARGRWALVGVGLAGLAAGAVGATLLVTAVFSGTAEDIGRGMAEEFGPAISEGVRDGMVEAAEEEMELYEDGITSEEYGWYAGAPGGDVEQFPPVEPEDLGPDEVLDEYAQSCFEGEYQACDDLLYESPPLSAYEEYASTCGGRVKEYTVPACTELE